LAFTWIEVKTVFFREKNDSFVQRNPNWLCLAPKKVQAEKF